jgi:hypothetical protein
VYLFRREEERGWGVEKEEVGEEREEKGEEDKDEEDKETTFGTKITIEKHIERAMLAALGFK